MFPSTKALWFNIQAEGQCSLRQATVYRQYPFIEQKQREAKVKVKETDPTCSQIWLFPVTVAVGKFPSVPLPLPNSGSKLSKTIIC